MSPRVVVSLILLSCLSAVSACEQEESDEPVFISGGTRGMSANTAGTQGGGGSSEAGSAGESGQAGATGAGGDTDAGPILDSGTQVSGIADCTPATTEQLQVEPGFTELLPDRHYEYCSPGMWCWSNPLPHGSSILSVWGSAADDAWAVGEGGTILHWDGMAWASVNSNTIANLTDVWGSGPDDVWAVGLDQGYPAYSGIVMHWDGMEWSTAIDGTEGYLKGVWGSSSDDVWSVGTRLAADTPFVMHWDGMAWSEAPLPAVTTANLLAVWGSGADDVWAAGSNATGAAGDNTLLHWDGNEWSPFSSGTEGTSLVRLWGSGTDDVWAVGSGYMFSGILHWDGEQWAAAEAVPEIVALYDVWGSDPDDVWAVGFRDGVGGNALLHWDGMDWSIDVEHPSSILQAVWGSATDDVWAFGANGDLLRWEGVEWVASSPTSGAGPLYATFTDIHGSAYDEVFAVGNEFTAESVNGVLMHWDGGEWTPLTTVPSISFFGVWANAPEDVWIVADQGGTDQVLHWNGTDLSPSYDAPTNFGVTDVWSSGPDDVWVFGGSLRAAEHSLLHWDGNAWSQIPMDRVITDLWGSAADDVWAVEGHTVHHWDGQTWSITADCAGLAQSFSFTGVWASGPNDAWVIGTSDLTDGLILRWNGSAWTLKTGVGALSQVWGSRAGDLWFTGYGSALHWDSVQWQRFPTGTQREITGIWGSGFDDVWAVGAQGMILHH